MKGSERLDVSAHEYQTWIAGLEKRIEELKAQREWISVEDELPPEWVKVVTYGGGSPGLMSLLRGTSREYYNFTVYGDGKWRAIYGFAAIDPKLYPTHWWRQPLPDPPEER